MKCWGPAADMSVTSQGQSSNGKLSLHQINGGHNSFEGQLGSREEDVRTTEGGSSVY